MRYLKQSTAATVRIGPFVDDTDGKTAETGLTIAQANVRLSKNGGDMAQKNDTTSCTHDEIGYYSCPLNATDTGTLGHLRIMASISGALPVWEDYTILSANVYDSLIGGGDSLDVNVSTQEDIDFGATQKASIATALLGSEVENSKDLKSVLRLMFAALTGKKAITRTAAGAGTITFRDSADTKNRISATIVDNERTAVTLDSTD